MQKLIFSLFILITVFSCKKSLDTNIDLATFSEVELSTIQENGSTAYLLKSQININPNEKITEYGFTYAYKSSLFDELFNDSLKILYTFNGAPDQSKIFEDTIYNIALPVAYSIRPYAINGGRLTLGKETNVTPGLNSMQRITAPAFTDDAINSFALSNGTVAIIGGGKNNRLYTHLNGTDLTFSSIPDTLPIDFANEYCTSFTLGNYGYIIGGTLNGIISSQVYQYDFSSNIWTKKQDFPGGARLSAVSAVVDNKAYVGFGAAVGSLPVDWWQYNEANDTWTSITGFPSEITGRSFANSFVIGKNVYVAGGNTAIGNNSVYAKNLWQFNTETKLWKVLPNCPFASGRSFGFAYKNDGYIGFGLIGKYSNIIVGYNEANAKWFGYYDGTEGALTSTNKAFAFKLSDKFLVANFENSEILRVK